MTYRNVCPARFIARPNRFIARVEVDGKEETVHVKNTGRCRELLVPGCTVWLEESAALHRKTRFDLIAVEKLRPGRPPLFINMDAQAPNKVFGEWMREGLGAGSGLPRPSLLRPETTWGNSRFDFYWEASETGRSGFVEVKGCTLEEDGLEAPAGTHRLPRSGLRSGGVLRHPDIGDGRLLPQRPHAS